MKIFVQYFPDKEIAIEVSITDTVGNLKALITDKVATAADQQQLIFANRVLQDDETLEACGITKEEIIQLEFRGVVETELTIKMVENQESFKIPIRDTDTVAEVKQKIANLKEYPIHRQKLMCRDETLEDQFKLNHYSAHSATCVFLELTVEPPTPDPVPVPWWKKCCCCSRQQVQSKPDIPLQ